MEKIISVIVKIKSKLIERTIFSRVSFLVKSNEKLKNYDTKQISIGIRNYL